MPNPERILLPGQFTKVKLLLDVREKATVVPLKSVIIEKGGAYIYVMRKDSTAGLTFTFMPGFSLWYPSITMSSPGAKPLSTTT